MSDQTNALMVFGVASGVIDQDTIKQIEKAQKPTVFIPGGATSITQSADELYRHIAPTRQLFLRDGHVCQVGEKEGMLRLELLKPAAACSRFEDFVNFARRTKKKDGTTETGPDVISKETAEKYLEAKSRYQLPVIEGLLSCPLITERGGDIHVVRSGYDPVTKLLITKNVALPELVSEEAVEFLTGILDDFQFQTPGDYSRAIASLITPALKFGGFIKGTIPADAAEADQSQAGKSYRQQMIAAIYNDTCALVTKPETQGVGGLEETFSTALVEGRPFIQFDNIRGKFSLQALEAFITATGTFPARPAYSKSIQIDPSKFMILISSNGYQTTVDLARRSSIIRILKRPGFAFRTWTTPDGDEAGMLEFIQHHQPLLLASVFAIIREWHRLGKQRTKDTRHDRREWCQILDWIVQNIFHLSPLMDGHQAAQERVANPDHTFLRQLALALSKCHKMNIALQPKEMFEVCEQEGLYIPGVANERRHEEAHANPAIGKLMKRVFGDSDSVEVDLYTITRAKQKVVVEATHSYPACFYTFTLTEGEEPQQPVNPAP